MMNERNVEAILKILESTGADTYFSDGRVAAELFATEGMLVPSALNSGEMAEAIGAGTDSDGVIEYELLPEFVEKLERIAKGET